MNNSSYNKLFNNNYMTSKNHYSSSPVSKHLKENSYHSTRNHLTQQFNNHANGNNFNQNRTSRPDKLFNQNDKITILKNNSRNRKNSSSGAVDSSNVGINKFWSESLMNFNINFDELWRECINSD